MRKIVALGALVTTLMVSNTFAHGVGGFYVGGNFGGAMVSGQYSYNDSPAANFFNANGLASSKKALLGAFFGYNHMINKFYLGGEIMIDGTLGGAQTFQNDTRQSFKHTLKRNGLGFGVIAKVGYLLTDNAAIYLGLGLKSTSYTLRSIDYLAAANNVVASRSHRSTKFHMQVGTEGMFCSSNLGWRMSYGYTPGKNITISEFPATHPFVGGQAKIKPNEHIISLGLFYRFKR